MKTVKTNANPSYSPYSLADGPLKQTQSTELFSLLSQSGLPFHLPPDLLSWLLSLAMGKHFLYFVMWKGRGMGQPLGAALENNLLY